MRVYNTAQPNAHDRRSGFTVVELLVVIAAVAILATIGIVGYSSFSTRAQNARTLNEAKEVAKAFKLYYTKFQKIPLDEDYWGEMCLSADHDACNSTYPAPKPMSDATLAELQKVGLTKKPALPSYPRAYHNGSSYATSKIELYQTNGNLTMAIAVLLKGEADCPSAHKTVAPAGSGKTTLCWLSE